MNQLHLVVEALGHPVGIAMPHVSTEPKLNSYLFLGKASIGATITAFVAKMCKYNFAQVLSIC